MEDWKKKARFLTHFLLISGSLNIGLISTFLYTAYSQRKMPVEEQLKISLEKAPLYKVDLLNEYSSLSWTELIIHLTDPEFVEEGYTKRDLALSCLVAFHDFDLKRALKTKTLQERFLGFLNQEQNEQIYLPLFPGLNEEDFQVIRCFAETEKWPLTPEGLFKQLKQHPEDPDLMKTFIQSDEFMIFSTFLHRFYPHLSQEFLVGLLLEGEWNHFKSFPQEETTLRSWLIKLLSMESEKTAHLFADYDADFALKRLTDKELILLLRLLKEPSDLSKEFALKVLKSHRGDQVCFEAAKRLFEWANVPCPETYIHEAILAYFFPKQPPLKEKLITHVVKEGENLWKIGKRYHIDVQKIKDVNKLTSDKLKPGAILKIPSS